MDPDKNSFSFSFSKTSEKKSLKSGAVKDDEQPKEETDFITSLENQQLKSVKPKEEAKELIIPLIKTNNWKTQQESKVATDRPPPGPQGSTPSPTTSADKPSNDGSLDSIAVQEIVKDTARQLEDWDERGRMDPENLQIPLLMQNQVPDGYETEEHLDVSLRPDEPEDADYDDIPIESFGVAMLKGMGWKPGQGIGKNNKAVAPVDAVLRPKGMGLGADRKQAQSVNSAKEGPKTDKDEDADKLIMKKGAACLIEKGSNKDLYGIIEGLDEDNARLMVKLTVSGKSVTVSQYNMRLVTDKEYKKYSKYLNKGAADRYKEKDDKKRNKDGNSRNRDQDSDTDRERKHRKEEDRLSGEIYDRKRDKYRDSDSKYGENKKDKHRESEKATKKRKYEEENGHSSTSHRSLWLRPKLRVRIVDERYKKGRYYNQKVAVVDVCDMDHCVCKTDDGKVLEDVSQSMLETVVPKTDSSYVSIVSGKYKGQLAHVLERDKRKCRAMLQLLRDRDKVVQLDYDAICEYIGDVDEEFDY